MLCGRLRAWLSVRSLLMTVLRSLVARRRFGPRTRWQPLLGTLASGLGLGGVSLAWSAVVRLLVFLCDGMHWSWPWVLVFVYSVIGLVFMFSLWCVDWVGGLCAIRVFFVCVSVLEVASRPGVGLVGCGCVLKPPVVCSAGRSGAVARCWSCSLLLCGLFCGAVCFVLCFFIFVFFGPF